jgi:hypothetical protein
MNRSEHYTPRANPVPTAGLTGGNWWRRTEPSHGLKFGERSCWFSLRSGAEVCGKGFTRLWAGEFEGEIMDGDGSSSDLRGGHAGVSARRGGARDGQRG